ncbi:hypothetical protein DKG34_40830 [Streptomyces sp. NWU49]|uniref:hypothetical protein n=1 Tax=Streptomyces sp. NWU49 TaxID=2201153 RepID=UPI000D679AF8|nr:hypothetical protein [Streptomyces sp. NWU49]PWJ02053.1 hypothetical protein DKG34_40830 [Streptomyces sp. NWU49]
MTRRIDDILSRALLVRDRTVPRDTIPTTPASQPGPTPSGSPPANESAASAAADLRALCETLLTHTSPTDVADFVTDQVPEPRSALVLACVLQLSDTDDGARYWWQYAAGAGQPAAAYCLYLHHLALGEDATANWWHRQTDDVQSTPANQPAPDADAWPWHPADHPLTSEATTSLLRLLRRLATSAERPLPAAVTRLMDYVPGAVACGYVREPEIDLPVPGPDFARRIGRLLAAAVQRTEARDRGPRPTTRSSTSQTVRPQVGETAAR